MDKKNIGWELITDIENLKDMTMNDIKDAFRQVESGHAEFLVIMPPEAIADCNFIQAIVDDKDGFHMEVSTKYEYGDGSIIYSKDGFDINSAMELVGGFIEDSIVPKVELWHYVGRFGIGD